MQVKPIQSFVGKVVSFAVAVPGAALFTRDCNLSIAQAIRKRKMVYIVGDVRKEVDHGAFLENWQGQFPWRDERHLAIKLAPDASSSRWGGIVDLDTESQSEVGDAWSQQEMAFHINE